MAVTTRNNTRGTASPAREVLKVTSRIVRRAVAERAPVPAPVLAERVRSLPIQCSIDIAVPLELAYEEWMKLETLPEGAHRVSDIERQGDSLRGRIRGLRSDMKWEAEILDDRPRESFAWLSKTGSDCAGLVTFHRLSDRLTRIELQLDVVPVGVEEAAELMLRLADRRAQADLRRLKAKLETISPDDYPEPAHKADDDSQANEEDD
jgi:uncharacterized membrane protein